MTMMMTMMLTMEVSIIIVGITIIIRGSDHRCIIIVIYGWIIIDPITMITISIIVIINIMITIMVRPITETSVITIVMTTFFIIGCTYR